MPSNHLSQEQRDGLACDAVIASTTKLESNGGKPGIQPRFQTIQAPTRPAWIYTNRRLPVHRVTASNSRSCVLLRRSSSRRVARTRLNWPVEAIAQLRDRRMVERLRRPFRYFQDCRSVAGRCHVLLPLVTAGHEPAVTRPRVSPGPKPIHPDARTRPCAQRARAAQVGRAARHPP
jgi:hypothetical protein